MWRVTQNGTALAGLLAVLVAVATAGPAKAVPMASHDYEFAGTLLDENGGPSLTRLAGGSLGTADAPGFTFGKNDGLQLGGAVSDSGPFSIEILFDFANLGRYFKIIDFAGRTQDAGLYSASQLLNLYPGAAGSANAPLTPGVLSDVLLTRAANGAVNAYVNGVFSLSYDDSTSGFTALNGFPLTFFADDSTTAGTEASSGTVRRIRTFSTVLSAQDAADLAAGSVPTAVPEPASLALLGIGLAFAAVRRRRPSIAAGCGPILL